MSRSTQTMSSTAPSGLLTGVAAKWIQRSSPPTVLCRCSAPSANSPAERARRRQLVNGDGRALGVGDAPALEQLGPAHAPHRLRRGEADQPRGDVVGEEEAAGGVDRHHALVEGGDDQIAQIASPLLWP